MINASELRYRRLFEAVREGILIFDAETGQIVDVNPILIEMLRYYKDVDNKGVIQCNIRDITERKIVEEALAQAPERNSAVSILVRKMFSSISIADISELILESAERFTRSTCGIVPLKYPSIC